MKVDITNSEVTILIEVDGQICAVKMDKDKLETVSFLIKRSVHELIKTDITQDKLNKFLLPNWFEK